MSAEKKKYRARTIWRGVAVVVLFFGLVSVNSLKRADAIIDNAIKDGEIKDNSIGIAEMILDETRTKVGHEYYQIFTSNWNPIEGLEHPLAIHEKADPLSGSIISIRVNGSTLFWGRINPRIDDIEKAAKMGVQLARFYVLERTELLKELDKP